MTVRAFVIGHPVAHSRSPLIHRYWLAALGIDGSYQALDVPPAELGGFLERLRGGAFAGGNVTIPHKQAVFAACDECDTAARQIGAVNTLVSTRGGLRGVNTDLYGFLASLDAEVRGWDAGGEAIVLGAGGAARAVVAGLVGRGFVRVHVLNRTRERADAIAARFGATVSAAVLDAFGDLSHRAGLLVNATSVGMHGSAFANLSLEAMPAKTVVCDLVYTPLETPLLAAARARGLAAVDGLGMLLHQAVPGFEAWFGARPDVTPALRAHVVADLERDR
ncbi:MAG TPA: shikimate dehydrogenase [Devosiaceae bacterium]|nr:shikimate dehydrogenase [Devosiaceae bacterium]